MLQGQASHKASQRCPQQFAPQSSVSHRQHTRLRNQHYAADRLQHHKRRGKCVVCLWGRTENERLQSSHYCLRHERRCHVLLCLWKDFRQEFLTFLKHTTKKAKRVWEEAKEAEIFSVSSEELLTCPSMNTHPWLRFVCWTGDCNVAVRTGHGDCFVLSDLFFLLWLEAPFRQVPASKACILIKPSAWQVFGLFPFLSQILEIDTCIGK